MIRMLALDSIRPNPYQTRDGGADLDELAASIRHHGVLQPVVVRPVGAGYELVAGERRCRAANLAGLAEVPAVVRELSDREAAVLCLIENLQRRDLHFFEEAAGYQRVIEEFGLTQDELAEQIGRSQATVANKLRLLRLDPRVRTVVARELLSERHARTVLRLPEEDGSRLEAVEAFARLGLSVREAERWVDRRLARLAPETRRVLVVLRDVRVALNDFRRTVRSLRESGFTAQIEEEEEPDAWVVRVRIAKRGVQR